jgi:hypothetical protein
MGERSGSAKLRVTLIDYPDSVTASGVAKQLTYDCQATRIQTIWNGGSVPLALGDPDVLFVDASFKDSFATAVHFDEHLKIERLIANGKLIVVFVGRCLPFHLDNLIGTPKNIGLVDHDLPQNACRPVENSAFDPVFAKHGGQITTSHGLYLPADPLFKNATLLLNARSLAAAAIVESLVSKGKCVYLPSFDANVWDVTSLILREVLPVLCPNLLYDDKFEWLTGTDYLMPSLAEIEGERLAAERQYEIHRRTLKERYEAEWIAIQSRWNRLLTSSGDELKLTVKEALEFFGFSVVDVDNHWSSTGQARQKEEDLWVAESGKVEPSEAGVLLGEVKSSEKGAASERDYSQLIKYLNRRRDEFSNLNLRGVLIVNHSDLVPARARQKAFGDTIVADSLRDKIVLATTWDLFRLVRLMLSGRTKPETIRALFSQPGSLALPDEA